jgi:hypothetical protein
MVMVALPLDSICWSFADHEGRPLDGAGEPAEHEKIVPLAQGERHRDAGEGRHQHLVREGVHLPAQLLADGRLQLRIGQAQGAVQPIAFAFVQLPEEPLRRGGVQVAVLEPRPPVLERLHQRVHERAQRRQRRRFRSRRSGERAAYAGHGRSFVIHPGNGRIPAVTAYDTSHMGFLDAVDQSRNVRPPGLF